MKINKPIFWAIFGAVVVLVTIIVLSQVSDLNREEDIFALLGRQTASRKTQFTQPAEITNWKIYRNEQYGFEFKYPENIFAFNEAKLILTHKLQNFHKYSAKDGSDLGLAIDISLAFKPGPTTCDYLENVLKIQSLGASFTFGNFKGLKYEMGAEGEGVVDYCIKDEANKNIFAVERTFLNESYGTNLSKQSDYIPSAEQSKLANQILSTFKFISPADTLNWKTYRNEEYGFEVKYPKYLNINEDNQSNFSTITLGGNTLHIGVENKLVKEIDICQQKKDVVSIGTQGTNWCFDGNPDDRWATFINRESGSASTGIVFYCWFPVSKKNQAVCDQILSTFKFIDSTDTANWKTYRNEEYGVEFKYPNNWYVLGGTKQVPIIISSTGKPAVSGGPGEEIIINIDHSIEINYLSDHKDLINKISSTLNFVDIPQPKLIGGDKDAGGCLIGAGYSWCEVKKKCLRVWEEKCE